MHQRRRRRLRQAIAQPEDELVHLRQGFGLRALPAFGPSVDLAFQEAGGLAQHHAVHIHGMQRGQAIHESLAHARAETRIVGVFGRDFAAQHQAAAALHHKEDGPDHGGIVAQQEHARSRRKERMNRAQHVVFARHIVGLGRDRAKRRASQHILAPTGFQ